jgi:hypothetical protein
MAVEARAPCGECNNSIQLGKCGVRGAVEWVQKKIRLQKWEDRVHGSATKKKKLNHTVIQNFFS